MEDKFVDVYTLIPYDKNNEEIYWRDLKNYDSDATYCVDCVDKAIEILKEKYPEIERCEILYNDTGFSTEECAICGEILGKDLDDEDGDKGE
jgi:hypothetical protein